MVDKTTKAYKQHRLELIKLILIIMFTIVFITILVTDLYSDYSRCHEQGGVLIKNAYGIPDCLVVAR